MLSLSSPSVPPSLPALLRRWTTPTLLAGTWLLGCGGTGSGDGSGGASATGGQTSTDMPGSGGTGGSSGGDSGSGGARVGAAGGAPGDAAGAGGSASGGETSEGSGGTSSGGDGSGGAYDGPWPPAETYDNPILWQDLADPEVIRVGDVFYYTGSNMHLSPGAPILRSYDLVNWEYAGHAIPKLDFGAKYDLQGTQRAYIDGDWASTLRFRESNGKFYFLGCIDFGQSYIWTADRVEGPWERHGPIPHCYYDAGMMIDEDDTAYVAYGNPAIGVAKLDLDNFKELQANNKVFQASFTLEGSRMYKRNGYYYIFSTRPADGQFVMRSTDPFGPYEMKTVVDRMAAPVQGAGTPHQGGMVETQNGDWYYMAFVDAYPGARMPVMAPITWQDDWPVVTTVNNGWGAQYPFPDVPRPPRLMPPQTGVDEFTETTLNPAWEWNHNPDDTKWSSGDGLTLQTATVTDDYYQARNTLTHRIIGPGSHATILLDYSMMKDGDVAGFGVTRHTSAFIGVKKAAGATRLVMVNQLDLNVPDWTTKSKGTEIATQDISGGKIWLRATADIRPGTGRQATFAYSTDGTNFQPFGNALTMSNDWQFFIAYRFMILNYATTALGGSIKVESFSIEMN